MPRYDFRSPRLFVGAALTTGAEVPLDRSQANYLLNVLRLKSGGRVLVFNGRDGEWATEIVEEGRKKAHLSVVEQIRPQSVPPDLHYLFAPLKQARLDYMIQKAVEMGACRIVPIITQFSQNPKLKAERMIANAIEAAEQCGILNVPETAKPSTLAAVIENWEPERRLIFCDEGDDNQNPLDALSALKRGPLGILIGPEGGFSEDERKMLRSRPFVTAIPLGPRVLRADTAAVAAMAVVQAAIGDWR